MTSSARHRRRAFTLIELVSVIVIMAAISAVAAPLIGASAKSHAAAVSQREIADSLGVALERIVRVIRETPSTAPGSGQPHIAAAEPDRVALADGHTIQLVGDTLWLTLPGDSPAPLCRQVDSFTLTYLASDGVTDASTTPTNIQRIEVTLSRAEMELRTCIFLRCARNAS